MDTIPASARRVWDLWDIRVLVIFSLILQIILFILGNRRKYMTSIWIRIVIWLAYLIADWVAAVALGTLSNAESRCAGSITDTRSSLHAIWAPLLLLHLGGPDTITSYSLEDNQLWLRHFLAMGVQVAVAIYILLLSWRNSWFSILTFPVFVAGVIKYGERTWVLMKSASGDPQHMAPVGHIPTWTDYDTPYPHSESYIWGSNFLYQFSLFPNKVISRHDTDEIFSDYKYKTYVRKYLQIDYWDTFEIAMGLMYDLLYTKTAITYSKTGSILRAISFSCTVSVLVGFFWIIFKQDKLREHYSIVDVALTGTLLVGALVLEIYAITVALSSDWMMIWLIKNHDQDKLGLIRFLFRKFPWLFSLHKKKRWSQSMGQFNLLNYCIEPKKPAYNATLMMSRGVLKLFLSDEEKLDKYSHTTRLRHLPQHLKQSISLFISSLVEPEEITGQKGLKDHNCLHELQKFTKKDLDIRIIIWHVATELCEFRDANTCSNRAVSLLAGNKQYRETSKLLSDYMLYLVVICPSMLPTASGDFAFGLTSRKIKEEVEKSTRASPKLRIFPANCVHDPIMREGYEIANFLMDKGNKKWEILTSVWVEMLCCAAKECDQNKHCQQLRRGGELLTLVWLLINVIRTP